MKGVISPRVLAWLIAITLIALPIVGVLQGWFAADRWPVRQLQVQGDLTHVSGDELKKAVAPSLRAGFFALDLERVRNAVAALPWVAQVEARKRWPDTLELRVRELHPIAHWGEGRLLGEDDRLFLVPGADGVPNLPHLAGPDDRVADVLAFYSEAQREFAPFHLAVDSVELSERGSWTLTLANGASVVIGRDAPEQKLARFIEVMPKLMSGRAAGFTYADLRYSNGFAVKWADAPATPAANNSPSTTDSNSHAATGHV
ncbi:MAG TPA: cell division protein FtsQ/DivIB [Rhodanobacteraceae bacterium]|nr:cell division protein FtsQ/DivIB [Rhodanobacteraceae bacterium]